METYGYDTEDQTMTCRVCHAILYEVPRTNLNKYRCWLCQGRGAEIDLLRHLYGLFEHYEEVGGYVTRTAQYPKQGNSKIRTADCKVVVWGNEWLIEVDESSHLWGVNNRAHRLKDRLVIENGLRLIRVHAQDDIATVAEEIFRITTGARYNDDDEPRAYLHALRTRPGADSFFRRLYGDEHDILQYYRNQEAEPVLEPVAEPVVEPVVEPEPEIAAEQEPEIVAEQEPELAAEPELRLLEEPRAEPLEISAELEVTITTLKDEFVSRFEEVANYFVDVEQREESEQRSEMLTQLADLLLIAQKIAIMCDSAEEDDAVLIAVIKRWLYAATSTLLFNGRAVSTTGIQRVEQTEETVDDIIRVEAPDAEIDLNTFRFDDEPVLL